MTNKTKDNLVSFDTAKRDSWKLISIKKIPLTIWAKLEFYMAKLFGKRTYKYIPKVGEVIVIKYNEQTYYVKPSFLSHLRRKLFN